MRERRNWTALQLVALLLGCATRLPTTAAAPVPHGEQHDGVEAAAVVRFSLHLGERRRTEAKADTTAAPDVTSPWAAAASAHDRWDAAGGRKLFGGQTARSGPLPSSA